MMPLTKSLILSGIFLFVGMYVHLMTDNRINFMILNKGKRGDRNERTKK